VKAELQGFSTVDYPNVVVAIGRNTTIEIGLSGAVEDVITVTAESPLLDEKSIRTGNTVSQTELSKIRARATPGPCCSRRRACSPTASTSAATSPASSRCTSARARAATRLCGRSTAW
jgi:hypothetical protein